MTSPIWQLLCDKPLESYQGASLCSDQMIKQWASQWKVKFASLLDILAEKPIQCR